MRPVRPGHYGPDLAAVARVRRRIASDDGQPVQWRRDMIKHLDALHAGLEAVITNKLLGSPRKVVKRARKRKESSVEVRAEG